jgi:hypothetical protein
LWITTNGGLFLGAIANTNLTTNLGEKGLSLEQLQEDEVIESKIHDFLDKKALELKKL